MSFQINVINQSLTEAPVGIFAGNVFLIQKSTIFTASIQSLVSITAIEITQNLSSDRKVFKCVRGFSEQLVFQVAGSILAYITIVTDSGQADSEYCDTVFNRSLRNETSI